MRQHLITAAAVLTLAGLAACGSGDEPGAATDTATDPQFTSTAVAGEGSETSTEETAELPELVATLAGIWEADPDEVGPHGSTLTINEDGTASLLSFASQVGTFEGEVFLSEGDPMRFEGAVPEDDLFISVGLEYDAEADTLTLEYPSEGGTYVHTRA